MTCYIAFAIDGVEIPDREFFMPGPVLYAARRWNDGRLGGIGFVGWRWVEARQDFCVAQPWLTHAFANDPGADALGWVAQEVDESLAERIAEAR